MERRRRFRFTQKARFGFRIVQQVRRQKLQCDGPLELRVLGLIDDPHTALAELLDDLVVADGGADDQDRGIVPLAITETESVTSSNLG
jgi:hypothetical protein